MIKRKVFYGYIHSKESGDLFDTEVDFFLETIINNNEYQLINYTTQIYGRSKGYMDCIRTEIWYLENPTRKVLTEKENKR